MDAVLKSKCNVPVCEYEMCANAKLVSSPGLCPRKTLTPQTATTHTHTHRSEVIGRVKSSDGGWRWWGEWVSCPDLLPEQNDPRITIVISVSGFGVVFMCLNSTVGAAFEMVMKISLFHGEGGRQRVCPPAPHCLLCVEEGRLARRNRLFLVTLC